MFDSMKILLLINSSLYCFFFSALPTLEQVPQEALLFFGQVAWSFGGAITGLIPTTVANTWFADSERALANTLITVGTHFFMCFVDLKIQQFGYARRFSNRLSGIQNRMR